MRPLFLECKLVLIEKYFTYLRSLDAAKRASAGLTSLVIPVC